MHRSDGVVVVVVRRVTGRGVRRDHACSAGRAWEGLVAPFPRFSQGGGAGFVLRSALRFAGRGGDAFRRTPIPPPCRARRSEWRTTMQSLRAIAGARSRLCARPSARARLVRSLATTTDVIVTCPRFALDPAYRAIRMTTADEGLKGSLRVRLSAGAAQALRARSVRGTAAATAARVSLHPTRTPLPRRPWSAPRRLGNTLRMTMTLETRG